MKKKQLNLFIILMLTILFINIEQVDALVCEYNSSGYSDETVIWSIDSSKDKPANMEHQIMNGLLNNAGREPVINWSDSFKGYKALDDINSGKCSEYLIQTFSSSGFQGYHVYLSDSASLNQIVRSDSVQKWKFLGFIDQDNSVIVYKLINREKSSKKEVTCAYTSNNESDDWFSLNYDENGYLIGSDDETDSGLLTIGFQLSYTAYETKLSENTCNINAYICADTESGLKRIFLNAEGLLNEDVTFTADSYCSLYKYDPERSGSESGAPVTTEAACKAGNTYFSNMKTAAEEYKKCKDNGSCDTDAPLIKFRQEEEKLANFCQAVYTVSYYSDSCTQYCTSVDSKISKLKYENGIEQINAGSNDCNISDRLASWIMKIIKWIRYIVPILLIALSILDYIKAIAADSEDEIKKVSQKFVKRLIVAALIFLIPLILEFLLGIFDISTKDYCL